MHVALLNPAFDPLHLDPEATLARFETLVGWAGALRQAGVARVSVLQRHPREAAFSREGVDYRFCPDAAPAALPPWAWAGGLLSALDELRPDLAHLNGTGFFALAAQARARLPGGARLVVQDHGGRALRAARSAPRRLAMRAGLAAADAFFFHSLEQAAPWREAGLIGASQAVYAVPETGRPAVSLDRAQARRESGVTGSPALLFAGRLNANKDPLTVLRGLALALPELPGAELTLAYLEDDLLPQVRALAEAEPLRGRVHLRGRLPARAMPACYAAADLFVQGSHFEGSGYALIEALAAGAVPVVTDIPSFREMTRGGALGELWRPGDPADLARALVRAWRRPQAQARAAASEHFARTLSWEAVGAQAVAAYREVLSRP